MFEDLPLFRSTIKNLKFMGFILNCNWRRYFCLVCSLMLNVGQFTDMLVTKKAFNDFARDAYIFVLWYSGVMRSTMIIINRYRYEKFMEELNDVYMDIEKNESAEVKQMLEKTVRSARRLATMNMALGTSVSIGLIIFPIFSNSRVLPYGVYVPGVDKYQTPWYEALYAFQIIITSWGNYIYLPFTNLIMAFIMFGVLRCRVLQCHLKNLKHLSREKVSREVIWCIRYQMDIMSYVKTINSLTSYTFLVEFLIAGALLCALMFVLNMVNSMGELVIVCFYLILTLSQTLSIYWFANELSEESAKVAVAAYDTDWYNFDLKTEKAIMMLIAQAQKPCEIMVGNMYPMTLQMFQSLLNTSYSYFTLLRRVYK